VVRSEKVFRKLLNKPTLRLRCLLEISSRGLDMPWLCDGSSKGSPIQALFAPSQVCLQWPLAPSRKKRSDFLLNKGPYDNWEAPMLPWPQ
jgi:hypothetical protein